ncbi:MAG: hypothetical protein LBM77_04875 [Spirochaetaceae bacterium]|jgi:hypothetical protein|nr:hypothetical protein [Spirochaetaceae bacterium]
MARGKFRFVMLVLGLAFTVVLTGCPPDGPGTEQQYEGKFISSVSTGLSVGVYYEDGSTTLTTLYNSYSGVTQRGNKETVTAFLVSQFADPISGASIVAEVVNNADDYGLSAALLGSSPKWAVAIKKL